MTARKLAVEELQAVELLAVRPIEIGELPVGLGGIEHGGFEVGDRRTKRVGKARVTRRRAEAVQACGRDDAREQERALRVGQLLTRRRSGVLADPAEDVVERPDRAAEERGAAGEKVVLDAADVRPVRDNQKRVSVESFEVAIEETRDFARVCGAHQESQRHLLDSRRLPGGL